MRIMWICGGLLPQMCKALNEVDRRLNGGFMGRAFQDMIEAGEGNQFCVLSWDSRRVDVVVEGVRHITFGGYAKTTLKGVPLSDCVCAQQIINEFNPEVIHILGTEGLFAHLPTWVFGGRKTVVSLQGIIAACAVNYSGMLDNEDMRGTWMNYMFLRYGATLERDRRFWKSIRAKLESDTLRRHQNFIGRTDFDYAWMHYYNPSARYYRVNESMRSVFYGVERCPSSIRPHTIFCGGAVGYPLKGGHIILRAVAALRSQYSDIQLRIANAVDLGMCQTLRTRLKFGYYTLYLRRLIRELNLEKNVVMLGPLSAEAVCEELKHAELFVLPSFCENSPNALAEAMLVGTPAVATGVGGVSSLLHDGESGRIVPPGDPALMALAIGSLFDNPEYAAKLASKAKKDALRRHDPVVNAQTLLSAYQSIVQASGSNI